MVSKLDSPPSNQTLPKWQRVAYDCSMKRCFALVMALLLAALPRLHAQGTDDQYVRIYNLIQEADSLSDGGHASDALSKYLQAQTALARFQKMNPDWNVPVVKFRLNYLASKVAALSAKVPAPSHATTQLSVATPGAPKPGAPADWENQLSSLRDQVHQLQS